MVFSDPVFLALFLPAALVLFHLLRCTAGGNVALAALIGLSMFFYAYWNVAFLALLMGQVLFNFVCARAIAWRRGGVVLPVAIAINLLLLGYFKYRNFFMANAGALLGIDFSVSALVVPLAISFHTFQQIALLVDVNDGEAEVPPLMDYTFFVLFFPQLIAGPIVLHREMGHQVAALRRGESPGLALFGPGFVLFLFGLFKKICLADPIGVYADLAFAPGAMLHTVEAWAGAIAYALQLFFDFSGYSDMAVGLGLMFGFRLPFNFLVPFAAPSMIEYWKRWHITMTRFFTMYVYAPVALQAARSAARRGFGGVRRFVVCVGFPTLLTFLLSGLWHGAGWNFVMFGAVNGIGLCINHAWRAMRLPLLPLGFGWVLTAVTVLVTLVYFRAGSVAQADGFLARMFVPDHLLCAPGWLLERYPFVPLPRADFEIFGDARQAVTMLLWIGVLAPLSVVLPALSARPDALRPGWRLAGAAACMVVLVGGLIDQPRSFLYFAF